jgi:hypothetical protein
MVGMMQTLDPLLIGATLQGERVNHYSHKFPIFPLVFLIATLDPVLTLANESGTK